MGRNIERNTGRESKINKDRGRKGQRNKAKNKTKKKREKNKFQNIYRESPFRKLIT
jgi:hypothetical protein